MKFRAESGGHAVEMDARAPIGTDTALTPKQLLLAGICGCTAMDVVALLKKHKQALESLRIEADARAEEGRYPAVFTEVKLLFRLTGRLDAAKAMEAVALSQTRYCSVSAMVSRVVVISYEVELNGNRIGGGQADFKDLPEKKNA